ncbi:MAG: hypothetical protein LBG96_07955 [Tannerella sp.]|jgi:hypothetical protein|nr:hypothetical protein [Tannerella sp.]
MPKRTKQITGCLLLLIFAAYYVNVMFFAHSHIIKGVTIVHSHFHNEAHTQTGTHSTSEITLISALSVFQSLPVVPFFVALDCFVLVTAVIRSFSERENASDPAACISLRAPPSSIA